MGRCTKVGKKYFLMLLALPFWLHLQGENAAGCAACVAAGKLAKESENKAFYALRILYEKKGRDALPLFRRALELNDNPPAQMRAAGYIADLHDTESIPQLEKILSELFKRVSFSQFGIGTVDYRKRWIVAYALGTLGAPGIAEQIMERYDRFTMAKKTEVPQILSALGDPQLSEHLMGIINGGENHQLMVATLDALARGGNADTLPFLRFKVKEWEARALETPGGVDADTDLDYFVLSRKAQQAIPEIEERLMLDLKPPLSRERPSGKGKKNSPSYF